jgi:hypothetical protein
MYKKEITNQMWKGKQAPFTRGKGTHSVKDSPTENAGSISNILVDREVF